MRVVSMKIKSTALEIPDKGELFRYRSENKKHGRKNHKNPEICT